VPDVEPLAVLGGWVLRWGAGRRFAIVMRAGEALEVEWRDDAAS
jgi:hypothetical protein